MCLDRITPNSKDPKEEGVGYKVFKKDEYHSDWFIAPLFDDAGQIFIEGNWIKDNHSVTIVTPDNNLYCSGFHLFETEEAAEVFNDWVAGLSYIKIVKYRNVIIKGEQGDEKVIVAREVMICQ